MTKTPAEVIVTAASVIAAYDKSVRANSTPDCDAAAKVAGDADGETFFEAYDACFDVGIVLDDSRESDMLRDAINAALDIYRRFLIAEVLDRPGMTDAVALALFGFEDDTVTEEVARPIVAEMRNSGADVSTAARRMAGQP